MSHSLNKISNSPTFLYIRNQGVDRDFSSFSQVFIDVTSEVPVTPSTIHQEPKNTPYVLKNGTRFVPCGVRDTSFLIQPESGRRESRVE